MIKRKRIETVTEEIEWINTIGLTSEDKQILVEEDGLANDFLEYAMDMDENARVEQDNDNGARLLSFDAPYFDSDSNSYTTRPLVFIIKDSRLYTFMDDDRDYSQINHLLNRSFQAEGYDSLYHMLFSILYQFAMMYHDKLRILHKERENIGKAFRRNADNNEIYRLTNVETGLVYLLSSLKGNKIALNTLRRRWGYGITAFSDIESEKLEDILVELAQAIEVSEINMTLVEKEKSTYSTIIDNNLNGTMKYLTIITSFLAVGEVTFGFFGMNTEIPFLNSPFGWIYTILVTGVFCGILGYFLWKMKLFK
ncbi:MULTISPECIES: magnesium transporter CorA family protein [unclassified Granulicatella]|uniref:magnesium transporter CorA family protein n=1 Tax=unclassified Granulicatella TaxID=2630493 RepID=UPI0010737803|nr:magnesium transporter CorA family protein [Granulicatella sp. WM01]MBF0780734.1 magnesium transporter CorA family protein [Granulicatella sp. 19428wC4_WM01]TFU94193.1 magnesium transporter CorA family protein [Granulicatella sp. WM01]